jgi:hypothetical protein
MGSGLFVACVYCASLLLPPDRPPLYGFNGELLGAYATLQREADAGTYPLGARTNVTVKFPVVGLGWSRPAPPGLGAGTPATEARVTFAWAVSHSEGSEPDALASRVLSTGEGRYENIAIVGRLATGERDSAEFFLAQHRHKGPELVNVGGSNYSFSEVRELIADRRDTALGWRHRFTGAEVAARLMYTVLQGKVNTENGALLSHPAVWGGGAEAAWHTGRWRLSAGGEYVAGSATIDEEYAPDFASMSRTGTVRMWGVAGRAVGTFGRLEASVSLFYESASLPWVALAMLGEELRRFDDGFAPSSSLRSAGTALLFRYRVGRGVWLKLVGSAARGHETVTFQDALDARPTAELSVRWPADRQYAVGAGVDFTLGGPPSP